MPLSPGNEPSISRRRSHMEPEHMSRAGVDNDATADDLKKMAEIVEAGIKALGFSTSRTCSKAIDGRYVPGTLAPSEELRAIAGAIGVVVCSSSPVNTKTCPRNWRSCAPSPPTSGCRSFNLSQFDQALSGVTSKHDWKRLTRTRERSRSGRRSCDRYHHVVAKPHTLLL